jgi:GSH-dependent disulfide-bond oxidoreductase
MGLPYEIHPVNIGRGDQFKPEFLAIAPNNRMPAIVDPEGPDGRPISIFESAARPASSMARTSARASRSNSG